MIADAVECGRFSFRDLKQIALDLGFRIILIGLEGTLLWKLERGTIRNNPG
jgi:hypothetical protein